MKLSVAFSAFPAHDLKQCIQLYTFQNHVFYRFKDPSNPRVMNRWSHPPTEEGGASSIHAISINTGYNTLEDQKVYEDPDYYYGQRSTRSTERLGSDRTETTMVQSPPPPGGAPPPIPYPSRHSTFTSYPTTHLAIHHGPNKAQQSARWKMICVSLVLGAICLILISSIIAFLFLGSRAQALFSSNSERSSYSVPNSNDQREVTTETNVIAPMELSANHLLTLLITRRKLCLFEASTEEEEESRDAYMNDHIFSARLLFHSNLSHSGVPVHPLQFQRVVRGLGVDKDCHVVLYDRGQLVWTTYAYWVFRLFGHTKVSILTGGYNAWKEQQAHSAQYRTESGPDKTTILPGNIVTSWNNSVVITFDDVFTNTELGNYDLVDAQTKEEYDGTATGSLYGHIRGAVNIPIESVYNWDYARWRSRVELNEVFRHHGLSRRRPIIVYCSTSLRASLLWWVLLREGYPAQLYFGGWPEWVVKAPDYLKVLATQ